MNRTKVFFAALLLSATAALSLAQCAMAAEKGKVRVVFHHLPLSMHPWAPAAAVGAACAQLQNSMAFWGMHDQIFHEQDGITVENVKTKLLSFARGTAVNLAKGSAEPNKTKVGKISMAQIEEIAKLKMPDLNSFDLEGAVKQVKGACRSMGVDVI